MACRKVAEAALRVIERAPQMRVVGEPVTVVSTNYRIIPDAAMAADLKFVFDQMAERDRASHR